MVSKGAMQPIQTLLTHTNTKRKSCTLPNLARIQVSSTPYQSKKKKQNAWTHYFLRASVNLSSSRTACALTMHQVSRCVSLWRGLETRNITGHLNIYHIFIELFSNLNLHQIKLFRVIYDRISRMRLNYENKYCIEKKLWFLNYFKF